MLPKNVVVCFLWISGSISKKKGFDFFSENLAYDPSDIQNRPAFDFEIIGSSQKLWGKSGYFAYFGFFSIFALLGELHKIGPKRGERACNNKQTYITYKRLARNKKTWTSEGTILLFEHNIEFVLFNLFSQEDWTWRPETRFASFYTLGLPRAQKATPKNKINRRWEIRWANKKINGIIYSVFCLLCVRTSNISLD